MLKTRVMACVCLKSNFVVQSIGFNRYLPVGALDVTLEYLDRWGIDEIVLLDLDATKQQRHIDFELIQKSVQNIQTPISIGGGISKISEIEQLIKAGADKVVLNSFFLENPELLKEAAQHFGSQCLIISIDAVSKKGQYFSYNRNINNDGSFELSTLLERAESTGAGEIFLNSVEQDGMKGGYDFSLFDFALSRTSLPIILCGGAGSAEHLLAASTHGVRSIAAGNFFHFTEQSVIKTKQYLLQNGVDIRLESQATFSNSQFDEDLRRVKKPSEQILEDMKFEYFRDEQI